MKKIRLFLFLFAISVAAACSRVDPAVNTTYFSASHPDTSKSQAISKLYEHYSSSDKTREYYEVVSKRIGEYILNYYPAGKLLTVCFDPGSGWSDQYRNVDESALRKMAIARVKLDDLDLYVKKDSIIERNQHIAEVKTNGHPN